MHIDVIDKYPESKIGHLRYLTTITDSCTSLKWVLMTKLKSEIFKKFADWAAHTEIRTGHIIFDIRSHGGGEFDNAAFKNWLERRGGKFCMTAPDSSHQNGVAERTNRTIENMIDTLMEQNKVPKNMWNYAAEHAANILNHAPQGIEQ